MKLAVLLSLAAFLIFLIFTVGVQPTKAEDCDCGYCHGANHHGDNWAGCSTCHDSPPQTGTHLTHYGSAPLTMLTYGDTSVTSVDDAYRFGCGNCHPLDNVNHNNGVVEVELYNPASPADSLKAKNPSNASYAPGSTLTTYPGNLEGRSFSWTDGTCSNVYCHSGYTIGASGPVGNPLTTADNPDLFPPGYKINYGFIMDETCSSLTYAPYTVLSDRVYQTTPAWGTTGSFSLCTECHQFPLTTWGPDVQAGVGDSHQWYNDWEPWNYGHANNMDYFPGIPCATCHYGTADHLEGSVANPPTASPTYWTQVEGKWIKGYFPVPLKSRVMHVNGRPDVSFDTANGYRYYYPNYINDHVSLTAATYDPATKTCSDVSCHYGSEIGSPLFQKKVKWGSPYRGWYGPDQECDQCHRMGYLSGTCE